MIHEEKFNIYTLPTLFSKAEEALETAPQLQGTDLSGPLYRE